MSGRGERGMRMIYNNKKEWRCVGIISSPRDVYKRKRVKGVWKIKVMVWCVALIWLAGFAWFLFFKDGFAWLIIYS